MANNLFSKQYQEEMKFYTKKQTKVSAPGKLLDEIKEYADENNISTMIDYGCGLGEVATLLQEEHNFEVTKFDPFHEEFSAVPEKQSEMLYSIDVMEHVEEENLKNVFAFMDQMATKNIFLVIDLWPAKKKLADGRNAHITIHHPKTWEMKINEAFPDWEIDFENRGIPQDESRMQKLPQYSAFYEAYPSRLFVRMKK